MREIKFRGKRIDNKKWVYGCYVFDEYQSWIIEYGENIKYEVMPATVGQYIGKKDKNGKEIYAWGKFIGTIGRYKERLSVIRFMPLIRVREKLPKKAPIRGWCYIWN